MASTSVSFRLEPGMEHGVGGLRDAVGADLAGGGAEQRQQLGGPTTDVAGWSAGLPTGAQVMPVVGWPGTARP